MLAFRNSNEMGNSLAQYFKRQCVCEVGVGRVHGDVVALRIHITSEKTTYFINKSSFLCMYVDVNHSS